MKQLNRPSLVIIITYLVLGGMVGCKKSSEKHDHSNQDGVQLDGGKKWKANAETTQGIEAMITLVDNYLANPTPGLKQLKKNLTTELTDIFQKCTMKGESHNQLHNYLLPLKEKLEMLNDSADEQKVQDIKQYLETYKNYFE